MEVQDYSFTSPMLQVCEEESISTEVAVRYWKLALLKRIHRSSTASVSLSMKLRLRFMKMNDLCL